MNNNKLESISGLEHCIILEELHVNHNRLRLVEEDVFKKLRFLKRLSLNDNFIEKLEDTMNVFKLLKYLEELDLFNNPIAKEHNYKELIIRNI